MRRSTGGTRRRSSSLVVETLEARQMLAGDLIISEFMARNTSTLVDEDGDYSDWIEVYNRGDTDVSLSGWHLTDDATELDKWSFPDQTLGAGNFLLVRASSKDRATAGQELHTNFKISSGGELLALTEDDPQVGDPGNISIVSQFNVAFPNLPDDVSYGIGQSVTVDSLIDAGDPANLLFPSNGSLGTSWTQAGFNDSAWTSGTNAIGYEQSVPGFTVHDAHSTGSLTNIAAAEAVLSGTGLESETTVIAPVVNFQDPGGGGGVGNYGNPSLFPNDQPGDDNDFAVRATGTIWIPSSGTWTFGTNSDDGVRFWVDGQVVIDDDSLHAPANRFGQTNLTAGPHSIELVFFERGGGAEVELFAAQGSFNTFNANAFRLIGDTAGGGLVVETVPGGASVSTGYSSVIQTDVLSSMYNLKPGAYMRIPFLAPNANSLNSLTLRMRYDDGFVAYLNGVEIARRNAPNAVSHDSTASSDRLDSSGLLIEDVDVSQHLNLLDSVGQNVLSIHALNDSIDSDEFLAIAELAEITVNQNAQVYFTTPTPGSFNSATGIDGFLIDEIQYSHPHGYYTNAFQLAISAATAGTTIRYTLDGTEPTTTNGTVYGGPIQISQTTTLRARAFKSGLNPSNVETSTYLFISDILQQSPTGNPPAGFPSSTNINGQVLDYGMDPDIVNDSTWGPQLSAALTQIPSMSIVMDIDDLLDGSTGIYTHAGNHGRAWERPASLEMINSDGSHGFHVNAGLRIRGGFSRSGNNPKHAFRLFFRDEYGDGKLKFPLFGSEGVDEFDKIDLRTTQNYSWSFQGSSKNAFVRDVFSRDIQGAMGHPYTRSRFYHLYINGQYWGLYQTEERPEAAYAESYFGGDREDYDVVKSTGSNGGYQNEATDGDLQAYQRLANYFYQAGGLSDSNMSDYWRAQGMNSDGTRNSSYERLLDVDNLIDYMLLTYYTSDADGPGSKFTRPRVNNYFGIFNRENPDGFKFFEHDSEHSLDTGNAAGANYNMVTPLTTGGSDFRYFNPHWMHERLAETNTEYRQRFADRVYESLFDDGLLTADNAKAVIDARAAQIDTAIIAESARWGDSKRSTPYTKSTWQSTINTVRNWIDNRIPTVVSQLQGQGWYPDANPPQYTVNGTPQTGGRIDPTDAVSLFTTGATSYTDIVSSGSSWKYLDNGSNQGTAWRGTGFNDNGWASGNAELGYGDGDEATVVSFGPDANNKYRTTYFRKTFNVSDPTQYQTLRLRLRRDDGAVVYLNGQEVARSNMPGGTVQFDDFAAAVAGGGDETTFYDFTLDISDLNQGSNTLAVEVHQANANSSDISFDLELQGGTFNSGNGNIYYTLDGSDSRLEGGGISPTAINFDGNAFQLPQTTIIKSRVKNGSEWSPLNTAEFQIDTPATAGMLAITEINYNPHDPLTQFGDANLNNDEFEFVELTNISNERIDLTDVEFVSALNQGSLEGIDFRFATQAIDAGERIVVVRNRTAFASRFGNSATVAERQGVPAGTGVYDGGLSNGGELLTLLDAQGGIIQQFEYNDSGKWPGRADGNGSTLEIVDPTGNYGQTGNWRSSNEFGGTPGTAGTGAFDDVIINEILAHTDLPAIDRIELHNTTGSTIDVGNWYVSDGSNNYFKYQFSNGTTIGADAYLVLDENQLGFGFKGQESDDAWLIEADSNGKPVRFADHVEFGATQNGQSLGRWPNASGRLFSMQSASFGSANSGPLLSDIMIGEIHYHSAAPPNGSTITQDELDFVEVHNATGSPADVSDWRLNKAIDFSFPNGSILSAGQRITVVGFDPVAEPTKAAEFRSIHGMNNGATLIGPYSGVLDNGGENLELDRPEDLAQVGLGFVLVDRADYDDEAPWPTSADGLGKSLHRTLPVGYGDFAASWTAANPTPGSGINTTNADPVAADDSYSVAEGGTRSVIAPGFLANDSDTDGDPLTAQQLTSPDHGNLTFNSDGSFTYEHDGSETTSDSFTYQVNDGNGGSATATVSIVINPVNDVPVATNDSYSLLEGASLIINSPGVLGNDTDADGDTLTASVVTNPQHGILSFNSNGSFSYDHDGSQSISDSFTYQVNDGNGGVRTATVTLNITPVNDPPTGVNDSYGINEGGTLTVLSPGPLDNDTDPDGDTLNSTVVTGTQHGSLNLNADGSFTYTHNGSETTMDSFVYQVSDNAGGADTATVTINIQPINDPPTAVGNSYSVNEGQTLNVSAPGLLGNDSDPENDSLTASQLTGPQHGTLQVHANGSFSYAHNGSETTSDSFTYRVSDGNGGMDTATVDLTIRPVNDPPTAVDNTYTVDEGQRINVSGTGLLGNDSDPENDTLTSTEITGPQHGTLQLNSNGSFSYKHDGSETTSDSFTYRVSDGNGGTDIGNVAITIRPANDPPTAVDNTYTVDEGQTINIGGTGVLGNDSDAENDSLTATELTAPDHGTLQLSADGSFSYTHNGSETTSDSFTYRVSDGNGGTDTGTVNITIRPVNDAPVANDDIYRLHVGEQIDIAAPGILGNDTEPDGDDLSATVVSGPANGTLQLNADGSFRYTHDGNGTTTDSFIYQISDGQGGMDSAKVTITVRSVNEPPVANGDAYTVNEGQLLTIAAPGVQGNDTDPEGDPLTTTVVTQPQHGSLTLNADGSFVYLNNGSEALTDSFTYMVDDNLGGTDSAVVSLTINPINDPPLAQADSYSVAVGETLVVNSPGVLGNDSDVDNATLVAVLQTGPQHGSLTFKTDGSFTYIHSGGKANSDSFTYKASDGDDESVVVTVSISIDANNIVGDFNDDGTVDGVDIALLCNQINLPAPDLSFDLTSDGAVDFDDQDMLISDVLNTYFGDATLDQQFDSTDLVTIFQAGEYEDDIVGNSTWAEGDWNCDGDFTTTDLIVAFQDGGYNQGPRPAAAPAQKASASQTASAIRGIVPTEDVAEQGAAHISRVRIDDLTVARDLNLQSRDLVFAEGERSFTGGGLEDSVDELIDAIGGDEL